MRFTANHIFHLQAFFLTQNRLLCVFLSYLILSVLLSARNKPKAIKFQLVNINKRHIEFLFYKTYSRQQLYYILHLLLFD